MQITIVCKELTKPNFLVCRIVKLRLCECGTSFSAAVHLLYSSSDIFSLFKSAGLNLGFMFS